MTSLPDHLLAARGALAQSERSTANAAYWLRQAIHHVLAANAGFGSTPRRKVAKARRRKS